MKESSDEYIGVLTLSRRIGISASALHKKRSAGSGPPYCKVGARVLYRWSDVLSWLEQRTATSVEAHRANTVGDATSPRPPVGVRHEET